MHRDAYTSVIILIVGFITINYISKEFIFEEKRLNKISENKFSSKITRYKVTTFQSHDSPKALYKMVTNIIT